MIVAVGRLVRGDGQHRLVAGRGAERVRHDRAEARAVVRLGDVGERVVLRGRAGDVRAVALPLVAERRGARGGHGEGGRRPDRDRAVRRLRRDGRRAGRRRSTRTRRRSSRPIRARGSRARRRRPPSGRPGDEMPVANLVTVLPALRIEPADPAAAEVGEEVVADVVGRELRVQRRVERAAGDRAAARPTCS